MLEDIAPPLTQLNTIAAWFLGTAIALAVIGLATMGVAWAAGRTLSLQSWGEKGRMGVILFFVAAILLGSTGGAIQWSSTKSKTEDLLPSAAKQKTIRVDRKAPHSKCTGTVSISAERHLAAKKEQPMDEKTKEKYMPTEAEAAKMGRAIREMGARKWPAEKAWTKSLVWGSNLGDMPSKDDWLDDWDEYVEAHGPMYSRIQWQPDGKKGNCDNTNFHAAKGAPVEVIFWETFVGDPKADSGQYGYRMFRIPVK